jgi:hypothetical protein
LTITWKRGGWKGGGQRVVLSTIVEEREVGPMVVSHPSLYNLPETSNDVASFQGSHQHLNVASLGMRGGEGGSARDMNENQTLSTMFKGG